MLLPGFEPGLMAQNGQMLTIRPWWKLLNQSARIGVAVHCYNGIYIDLRLEGWQDAAGPA